MVMTADLRERDAETAKYAANAAKAADSEWLLAQYQNTNV
jgi:hypothetical protein